MTKQEMMAARKQELAKNLKVGAFVKNVWGATMQSVSYWEIVSIQKNVIALKPAMISGDPHPNCSYSTVTLLGSRPEANDASRVEYATTRMGYLVKKGASLNDYWSTYEFVQVGDTTSCWSD